jgi:hypothetical protein
MDAPLDLYRASREDFVQVIVRQREQSIDLEQEVTRLRADLATQQAELARLTERVGGLLTALASPDGDASAPRPTTRPGLKPAGTRRSAAPSSPRKRRAHGEGRRRLRPTARQVQAYAHCPHCRTPLRGGTVKRPREVREVAPTPVVVTEPGSLERRCPHCGGRWLPGPELAGVVVGQGRLGIGLLSLIATLREELRLPVERLPW